MEKTEILEPQTLRLQVDNAYTGVRLEAETETNKYTNSEPDSTYDRYFTGPVFGLSANGSVYHPNLMRFTVDGEISPGYRKETSNSAVYQGTKESLILGNYFVNCIFLGEKPYRFSLSLNQDYSYRDYDFYNRVEVNSIRYGGSFGYQAGRVPFLLNIWRRYEDVYGQASNSNLEETGLSLDAHNPRASGETSFTYNFSEYTRTDQGFDASDTEHAFGIGDTETFGNRKQIQLNSNANYTKRESANNPTDDLAVSSNMSIEHTPTLTSNYDGNFYRSTADSSVGSAESENYNGGISLRHQLYESLSSSVRIQGQEFSSNGNFTGANGQQQSSSSTTSRYGLGWAEQYNKRLGTIGHLTIMGSLLEEHTSVDNGGSMLVINGERHSFSSFGSGNDSFFLNLPFVDASTIVVTDGRSFEYQEGTDYTVSTNGSRTMLRRTATSMIPQNATIFVDYRAQSSPSGDYNTLTSLANVRIDLWSGLFAMYYRYSASQSDAAPELRVQDMKLSAFGVESTWRWLHLGAEYETDDSLNSSYQNVRFMQSLAFKPGASSTLNFDFSESQSDYTQGARTEQNYSFMTRYRRTFSRRFGMNMDGGVAIRKGEGVDQTLAAFRPGLQINFGRIDIKITYNFEYGKYVTSNETFRNMLMITGRRNF